MNGIINDWIDYDNLSRVLYDLDPHMAAFSFSPKAFGDVLADVVIRNGLTIEDTDIVCFHTGRVFQIKFSDRGFYAEEE